MAIEYFHISESDHDMLEQIMELEQEVHPARGTGLNYFEAHSFIRYGRCKFLLYRDPIEARQIGKQPNLRSQLFVRA